MLYREIIAVCSEIHIKHIKYTVWAERGIVQCGTLSARSVRKVSSHFEYLGKRSRGLDVTWQPFRGDLTVHP
jgi:hypothetical protein